VDQIDLLIVVLLEIDAKKEQPWVLCAATSRAQPRALAILLSEVTERSRHVVGPVTARPWPNRPHRQLRSPKARLS